MSKYGELIGKDTLRFTRDLPGPIDRVWDYLTEPDKRALWLADGATSPDVGGEVDYNFDNLSLTPHQETVPEKYQTPENPDQKVGFSGKVLAYDPPHLLRTTWPASDGGNTILTFKLTEYRERVTLEVTHENITRRDERIGASAGWHVHLDILTDKLLGRVPSPFWATHTKVEAEYHDMFPT